MKEIKSPVPQMQQANNSTNQQLNNLVTQQSAIQNNGVQGSVSVSAPTMCRSDMGLDGAQDTPVLYVQSL
jgi:hypothetical protein